MSARADELLKSLEMSKTMRGRVENLLIPILHTGEASMDMIAVKLGLSRQTLFRKLKAEGITFEKVLDELRHKLALHYLNGKKVPVNQTGLFGRVLGAGCVLARVQALDRIKPTHFHPG